MRLLQRAAAPLVAAAVIAVPVAVAGPAQSAPVGATGTSSAVSSADVACLADTAARLHGGAADARVTPKWRHHDDHTEVTAEDLAALPQRETRRAYVNREVRTRLAPRINIPVYVHVIKGNHKGERGISKARARNLVLHLNRAMTGHQNSASARLRYRFQFRKIDFTKNERWYHAYLFNKWDKQAKRKLHRGGSRSLNLYINGGGPQNTPVLGWARFPWQYASTPKMDGVTVNVAALRGGSARGYNLNDTVIHETGHWLGLYHTFQGGCSAQNDLIADTPAESQPSFGCDLSRDTCPAPGLDPVRNFMDYSLDRCMNMFTAGQVQRVDAAFEKWRK